MIPERQEASPVHVADGSALQVRVCPAGDITRRRHVDVQVPSVDRLFRVVVGRSRVLTRRLSPADDPVKLIVTVLLVYPATRAVFEILVGDRWFRGRRW